jgi:RNA-directed DNA polymerase
MHENRETSGTPAGNRRRSAGEGLGHTARVYVCEESHSGVVPMNHSNKDGASLAENEEGRPLIKENAGQSNTRPTQSGEACVSQGLTGVRKAVRDSNKEMRFTALLHHLTVGLLRESFYSLKRKATPGVDGVTWQEYERGVEDRVVDLHGRVHRGAYRAKPSRRVYIEKADGRKRPLGVAALEDKIVQHAVGTILNQIYEEDFLGFSYGFRPGRSPHDALDALSYALLKKKVNYVLDADISSFFDTLDKGWLVQFVEHRVAGPHPAADPEMVESRSDGGRQVVGSEDRESARFGDFTAPGEHLPALLFRSLGERLAQEVGARRGGGHPLRGRHDRGIPISDRRRSLPGKLTGTTGKVRTGTPPG